MTDQTKLKINSYAKIIIVITSIIGFAAIVFEYGFQISKDDAVILHYISIGVVGIFILYQFIQLYFSNRKIEHIKSHKIEFLILVFIIVEGILILLGYSLIRRLGTFLHFKDIAFLYIVFAQIYIIVGLIAGGIRYNKKILQLKIHPSRLFVLSFVFLITIGTLLLLLPASTAGGKISFIDALFTSTSAVCVTGLITVDTAVYFTKFGQLVIMLLFQIGGLGLMTFTTFFTLFLAGGIGIKERILLHDLLAEDNVGTITKVLAYLTIITITIEAIGAVILFQSVAAKYPNVGSAIFISVFHSISAFCNAGFSLFTLNLYEPLVRGNVLFTTTISILIILGGIGFPTIMGLLRIKSFRTSFGKFRFKLSLQIRMILYTTLILLIVGTVLTFILEYNNSLAQFSFWQKLDAAYFQSVTSRTAGFNTIDITKFAMPTTILFLFLMFVGASPGGTGGGIKTTTFAIIIASTFSFLRNEKSVTIRNRTIPNEIVLRAVLKTLASIAFITLGIFLLTITENKSLIDIAFETFSAFGTVGLSRGITSSLSDGGKLIITLLMLIGRVGPFAFLYSILKNKATRAYDLPTENISTL